MILYLDTETGPSRRLDVAAWLAAKHYDRTKDPEDNAKAATKALADTSLSATLCELHVVCMAVDDGPVLTYVNDGSEHGEARLIEAVAQEIFDLREEYRRMEIVAFNADFDKAVLRAAAMRHRVRLPKDVHGVGIKPWESCWRCAMEPLKSQWNDNVSLEKACLAFRIPLTFGEAGDLPGSEVGAAIARGEIQRVAHHCGVDVERVRAVWSHVRALDTVTVEPVDEANVRRIMREMEE